MEMTFDFEDCPTLSHIKNTSSYNPLTAVQNISEYGGAQDLWDFITNRYGEKKILSNFLSHTEDAFGFYKPYEEAVNRATQLIFKCYANKYEKLKNLDSSYDPFSPYNIQEEHATGNKQSKMTNQKGSGVETSDYETSFDNLTPKQTAKSTSSTNGSDSTYFENNVSETFKDNTMNGLSSSEKKYSSRVGNIGNHVHADIIRKELEIMNFSLWNEIAKDFTAELCYKIF